MADFASYREKDTEPAQVINLDHVGTITVEDNAKPDETGEAYIIFNKFIEAPTDGPVVRQPWYKPWVKELMRWNFSVVASGESMGDVIKRRDEVCGLLVGSKVRDFAQVDKRMTVDQIAGMLGR